MVETADIEKLLNNIVQVYGYDFTGYSHASLRRRVDSFYVKGRHTSFAGMQQRLLEDPTYFMYFVEEVTVNVTEMFRDAGFYKTLRQQILPVLATYPFIRIWHAGCSTGEEVYSMAILLQAVLEKAKTGIFSAATMQQNSENYIKSGGKDDFSAYYYANYNNAKFHTSLSERMIFSTHNLAADSSFNEFQLILCRNVLIYFDRELQGKVLQLFDRSLDSLGFLALGSKESLRFSTLAPHYKQVENKEKIWRKNR
jgi:chemotaxis protein methyltransferase CheR